MTSVVNITYNSLWYCLEYKFDDSTCLFPDMCRYSSVGVIYYVVCLELSVRKHRVTTVVSKYMRAEN